MDQDGDLEDSSSSTSMDSFLFCDICSIQASSESQLRSHLLGQKHWFNVRQRDMAQRSVYVRGFPAGVGAKRLSDLFQQFGNVHKVVVDDNDKFAIVEFTSTDSALQSLRFPHKLTLDGSKLVVKPREFKVKKKHTKDSSMETDKGEEGHDKNYPLKLNSEQIEAITSLQTLDEQILSLAAALQIPSVSLTHIHCFISYLQSSLQRSFPSCRVIPFGSIVTGLATPTSDLDAVVLTQWSPQDEANFGHTYYKPLHNIEETQSMSDNDTLRVVTEFSFIQPTSSTFVATPPTTPLSIAPNVTLALPRRFRDQSFRPDCVAVVNELSKLKECGRILFMGTARCPVIRFTHKEYKVACDLSVNNRLGAYNSSLLQAYFNFDPRIVPLLHILKSWIRSKAITGLSKVSLNNYALSLMLIYSLQKTTPSVLPCLQSPGAWPRNMEWYGRMGFSMAAQEPLIIEGWNVSFIDPRSLLPSQNKASLGELLCHFFNFYSHIFPFSSHAIAIHSNTPLTIQEASELGVSNMVSPTDTSTNQGTLRISPLVVQDPFDLSHNVTKGFYHSSLHILIQEMSQACVIVNDLINSDKSHLKDSGILSLFNTNPVSYSHSTQSANKLPRVSHTLQFELSNIQTLLSKIPSLSSLSNVLSLLDLKSPYIQRRLQAIVMRSLVILLEERLNFHCVPLIQEQSLVLLQQGPVLSPVSMATGNAIAMATNEMMESCSMAAVGSVLKRPQSEDIETSGKKIKTDESLIDDTQQPVYTLEQYCYTNEGRLFPLVIKCIANSITWRRIRRQKRHGMDSITGETPCLFEFTMSIKPLLLTPPTIEFPDPKQGLVSVNITISDESMSEELMHFYAYFVKMIVSLNE